MTGLYDKNISTISRKNVDLCMFCSLFSWVFIVFFSTCSLTVFTCLFLLPITWRDLILSWLHLHKYDSRKMSALFYVWEFYLSHNIAIYADKSGHFVRLERVFGSGVLLGIVLMYSYVLFHEVLIWLSNMCWPINSLNVWRKKKMKKWKNHGKVSILSA